MKSPVEQGEIMGEKSTTNFEAPKAMGMSKGTSHNCTPSFFIILLI